MSKWISVKDRLPEDQEKVTAINVKGDIETMFNIYGEWYDTYGSTELSEIYTVIHWQPLPAPPEEL